MNQLKMLHLLYKNAIKLKREKTQFFYFHENVGAGHYLRHVFDVRGIINYYYYYY